MREVVHSSPGISEGLPSVEAEKDRRVTTRNPDMAPETSGNLLFVLCPWNVAENA